jgi:hypothetical protein
MSTSVFFFTELEQKENNSEVCLFPIRLYLLKSGDSSVGFLFFLKKNLINIKKRKKEDGSLPSYYRPQERECMGEMVEELL